MNSDVLMTGTRRLIYDSIGLFPGIHFRDLMRNTNTTCGQATYHIHTLKKSNSIEEFRHKRNLRLFLHGFSEEDKKIISNLRNINSRNLIVKIIEIGKVSHSEASSILNFSPSTTTWYLKKLQEDLIIGKERGKFHVINPNRIGEILKNYRESFSEKLMNNFIDSWEF